MNLLLIYLTFGMLWCIFAMYETYRFDKTWYVMICSFFIHLLFWPIAVYCKWMNR